MKTAEALKLVKGFRLQAENRWKRHDLLAEMQHLNDMLRGKAKPLAVYVKKQELQFLRWIDQQRPVLIRIVQVLRDADMVQNKIRKRYGVILDIERKRKTLYEVYKFPVSMSVKQRRKLIPYGLVLRRLGLPSKFQLLVNGLPVTRMRAKWGSINGKQALAKVANRDSDIKRWARELKADGKRGEAAAQEIKARIEAHPNYKAHGLSLETITQKMYGRGSDSNT